MEKLLHEGTTSFVTDSEEKITKDMPVFYNPVMKFNRDLTLAVLLAMPAIRKDARIRIALPMEASGIRAARILHELVSPGHFLPELIALNDISIEAIDCAQRNVNKTIGDFDPAKVRISQQEASLFLRQSAGFDYIDIDPFGSPNPFLDAAVQRISKDGILAVTATDTSALAGTYPTTTARKYWAKPSRTWVMHEVGLRILTRKVQLVAAQYDRPLLPVLAVSTDHYYRVFFMCMRGTGVIKDILKRHQFLHVCSACMQLEVSLANWGECSSCGTRTIGAGPMWCGPLFDVAFVKELRAQLSKLDAKTAKSLDRVLAEMEDECKLDGKSIVGFVDVHELCSRLKRQAPRMDAVLERLGDHGCKTHIVGHGVKTDLPIREMIKLLP